MSSHFIMPPTLKVVSILVSACPSVLCVCGVHDVEVVFRLS